MAFFIISQWPRSGLSFQSGSGLSGTGSPFFNTMLCSAALIRGAAQHCAICSDLSEQLKTYTTVSHIIQFILPGHLAHYSKSSACHRLIFIGVKMVSFQNVVSAIPNTSARTWPSAIKMIPSHKSPCFYSDNLLVQNGMAKTVHPLLVFLFFIAHLMPFRWLHNINVQ